MAMLCIYGGECVGCMECRENEEEVKQEPCIVIMDFEA